MPVEPPVVLGHLLDLDRHGVGVLKLLLLSHRLVGVVARVVGEEEVGLVAEMVSRPTFVFNLDIDRCGGRT